MPEGNIVSAGSANMPKLYVYTDNKLRQFVSNSLLIQITLEKYGIKLRNAEFDNLEAFAKQTMEEAGYTSWDLHTSTTPVTSRDLHYHMYMQGRLIVKGHGSFYFEIDNTKLELIVGPSDFIKIPPKVIHYFNTVEPVVAVRFFSTDDGDDDRVNSNRAYS
jgi:cupin superfamily acireductone dioxygenase involved in methionine salvage